ncbi:MAG: exodeoxyribonuclease VII large subunit [Rhizomicrobium sp.]
MSEAPARPTANLPEFSVSELSFALKRTVEDAFPFVRVRGEVSKVTFQSSGHVYFDLKDDKAVLNAVCWRGTAQRLKVKPQQGLEVVCTGRISTYPGSSRYQAHRRAGSSSPASAPSWRCWRSARRSSPPRACSTRRARRSCPPA